MNEVLVRRHETAAPGHDVQLVERCGECRLVGNHRFDRLELDDAGRLDDGGDERGGDVGGNRVVPLGGAFGRQAIEPELSEPVVQPLVIGDLRRVDAHQLRQPFGARDEADHVLGRVVGVDHERAARRHPPHVIPPFHHRLLDQHDDVRLLVLVGERILDHAVAQAAVLPRRRVRAIGIVDVVLHRLRELAFEAAGGGDRIDDVAALLVHDDAARPHGELCIRHDQSLS